jgi:serine/threonine protein kinase
VLLFCRYVDGFIDPATNELVIVLEWAQGGDMKNLIRRVKKAQRGFSERQVWRYALEMAQGIKHMHDKVNQTLVPCCSASTLYIVLTDGC